MKKKRQHELTKHHRKPSSIGGNGDPENISHVPRIQHEAWHTLFSNHTAQTITAIINEKWLDPEFEIVCQKRSSLP